MGNFGTRNSKMVKPKYFVGSIPQERNPKQRKCTQNSWGNYLMQTVSEKYLLHIFKQIQSYFHIKGI